MGLRDSYHSLASPVRVKQNLCTFASCGKLWVSIQSLVLNKCATVSSSGLLENSGLKYDQLNCGTCNGGFCGCIGLGWFAGGSHGGFSRFGGRFGRRGGGLGGFGGLLGGWSGWFGGRFRGIGGGFGGFGGLSGSWFGWSGGLSGNWFGWFGGLGGTWSSGWSIGTTGTTTIPGSQWSGRLWGVLFFSERVLSL